MNITDPKIVSLRTSVKAAQQEFDLAVPHGSRNQVIDFE